MVSENGLLPAPDVLFPFLKIHQLFRLRCEFRKRNSDLDVYSKEEKAFKEYLCFSTNWMLENSLEYASKENARLGLLDTKNRFFSLFFIDNIERNIA